MKQTEICAQIKIFINLSRENQRHVIHKKNVPCTISSHVAAISTCFVVRIVGLIGELKIRTFASSFFQKAYLQSPNFYLDHLNPHTQIYLINFLLVIIFL